MLSQRESRYAALARFLKNTCSKPGSMLRKTPLPPPPPSLDASRPAVGKPDDSADLKAYWGWNGHYIGYRASDGLFHRNGQQIGYFAEGDEIYACSGNYLGEVRAGNRLITNVSKKAWTRSISTPRDLKRSVGHRDLNARDMLPGYFDFPA